MIVLLDFINSLFHFISFQLISFQIRQDLLSEIRNLVCQYPSHCDLFFVYKIHFIHSFIADSEKNPSLLSMNVILVKW